MDRCDENCQYISSNICGVSSDPSCRANANCLGKEQWTFEYNKGWCYGDSGCQNFCTYPQALVDWNHNYTLDPGDRCGCTPNTKYWTCDIYPYNLDFKGFCNENNVCEGDDIPIIPEDWAPVTEFCTDTEIVDVNNNKLLDEDVDK